MFLIVISPPGWAGNRCTKVVWRKTSLTECSLQGLKFCGPRNIAQSHRKFPQQRGEKLNKRAVDYRAFLGTLIALYAGMSAAVYADVDVHGAIAKPDLRDIVQLVKGEYLEMPGLCLTRAQVQRLWDLDRDMSVAVLQQLVKEGFLCRSEAGTYGRRDWR